MEATELAINFLWAFVLTNVLFLIALVIFKKHKQLIAVIYYFILLIMVQRDYIFEDSKTVFPFIALILLGYYIFFRELFSFIKTKKTASNN